MVRLVALLCAVGLVTSPAGAADPPAKKPNIVFILADDLGYGDLGCYGQDKIRTPKLDRMASEGMRFTQCYAGSTVCAPSRCSLMTGMTTGHCTIRGNAAVPLRPQDKTVAELLGDAGYATALIGKWGLGGPNSTGQPNKNGFDEFYGDRDWPEPEKSKAAMITHLDAQVGKILSKLRELRIDENTIVFFTSDNGPHKEGGNDPRFFDSSGGLRGIKRDLYEGGIREPMIVRWPKQIQAGSVSDLPWAFWDFLPTCADLAGVQPPDGSDGISVVPTLLGKGDQKVHEYLYWEFHEGGSKQAVRVGDWKALRFGPHGPIELYDLRADVGEQQNVAGSHSDVVAKAEKFLDAARTPSDRWPLKAAAKPNR